MFYYINILQIIVISLLLPVYGQYNVGVGIADVTGPIAEVNFMGYASLTQSGRGLHTRLFSRAFIFERDNKRVAFVYSDLFAIGPVVKKGVLERLNNIYGDIYNDLNLVMSGSHSHSVPGGYLGHLMFDATIRGFVNQTAEAYIEGLTLSIIRAHESLTPARLEFSESYIEDVCVNRSPTSYLTNPAEERARYTGDTESSLSQLRIVNSNDNSLIGLINWFPIHPTSMNVTNSLVSSDNVGYAAMMLEKTLNDGAHPGTGSIVVAFAQSSQGDISPNTDGPKCEISRDECDNHYLLCPIANEQCFAVGPGSDMFESTQIIGTKLYESAMRALEGDSIAIDGEIYLKKQYINMEQATGYRYDPIARSLDTTTVVEGCFAAMGYSFAAGTTDGAGLTNFTQGEMDENPLLVYIRDFLGEPTDDDIACHSPKPILLATGRSSFPYPWHPSTVSISVGRIGNLLIASVPAEFTTMSGRRTRDLLQLTAAEYGQDVKVVLTGFAEDYSHYVATYEEYQEQRYEAASTLYGPHTLEIYLTKLSQLTRAIFEGIDVDIGTPAEEFFSRLLSFVFPVIYDGTPSDYEFGDVYQQPESHYEIGDTVSVVFISGHPRNNIRQGDSYANIEKLVNNQWIVVATDADWETKFIWSRVSTIFATSRVTIEWTIPEGTASGEYRIHHYGDSKSIIGTITPYEGVSNVFTVEGISDFEDNNEGINEEIDNDEELLDVSKSINLYVDLILLLHVLVIYFVIH